MPTVAETASLSGIEMHTKHDAMSLTICIFSAIKLQPKQSHYSPASKQETTMMHSKAACM